MTKDKLNLTYSVLLPVQEKIEKCPFVSEKGPSCELCGAPPISVNLDPQGGYAFCDECGGKFRIKRKRIS